MSDSSSEEVIAPKAKAKAAVVADDSDDSSEDVPKKTSTVAPKAKAAVQTDSEDESMPARPAPKAVVADDSDSDEDEAPATRKITEKAKVIEASSDDSDDSDAGEAPAKVAKDATKSEGKKSDKGAKEQSKQDTTRSSKKEDGDEVKDLRVCIQGLPWKTSEADVRKDFSKCGEVANMKLLLDDQGRSKGMAFITYKTQEGMDAALKRDGDTKKYHGRTLKVAPAKPTKGKDPKTQKLEDAKRKERKEFEESKAKLGEVTEMLDNNIFNMAMIRKLTNAQESKNFLALEHLGLKIAKRARTALDMRTQKKAKTEFTAFISGIPVSGFDREAFTKRFEDCGPIKYAWLPVRGSGDNKGFGTITFKTEEAFQKALKYDSTKCKGSVLKVVKSEVTKKVKGKKNGEKAKESVAQAEEPTAKRKAAAVEEDAGDAKQAKKKKKLAEATEDPPRQDKKERKAKAIEEAPVEEEVAAKKKKKKTAE